MKRRILDILKSQNQVISGERISDILGVSRVSVWKHIKGLGEMGYQIASTPKGYRLENDFDVLSPWAFPGREKSIHCFSEIGSTMDTAREMARKGCPHLTVVAAERQGKGRGRLDRAWVSEKGGLYFTLIIRPEIPPQLSFRFNFCASWALAQTLREDFDIPAMVKWPNDILVNDRKLVGMLSEMETRSDMVSFVNIGIGVNVNNDTAGIHPPAVSMQELTGRKSSRAELLSAFLDRFEKRTGQIGQGDDLEKIVSDWKRYSGTIGRRVRIVTVNETVEGEAADVDDTGALLLRLDDGNIRKIIYGDCFY